jgi:hypothetical protein
LKEIDLSWGSLEAILKSGYEYAAVLNNDFVSRAMVTCNYRLQDNMGVDTLQDYRRKGILRFLLYDIT